jgi:nucleoside-diphosphate-sugar epimerase
MRVLVAGGSGFVGRSIVSALAKKTENKILTLSRSEGVGNSKNVRHVVCDWCEVTQNVEIKKFAPQVIINAVGDSHPRNSVGREADLVKTNILPFFDLLDQSKKEGSLERVVFVSSAGALYRSALDHRLKSVPDSAYFSIKYSTELLLASWCAAQGIVGASIRLTNPVGNNFKDGFGVVNHFARALLRGEEVKFVGDYKVFKDYIDVADAGEAIAAVSTFPFSHQGYMTFDLGSGVALSAEGVYAAVSAIAKGASVPLDVLKESSLETSSLFDTVGWTPQRNIMDTFNEVFQAQKKADQA